MPLPLPEQTPVVVPSNESRLDALCAELSVVDAEYNRIKTRWEELRTAVKKELALVLRDGQHDVHLRSPYLPLMRFHCVRGWRVDAKTLKAQDPEIYVKHAVRTAVWKLEKV